MSEEILKALMQLFAIILKQDGVVSETQHARVEAFLKQQISPDQVPAYLSLFEEASGYNEQVEEELDSQEGGGKKKLTSMKDSVRTLGICKKINKTLEQKQKIVVFTRILEMISSDKVLGPLAMEIIETVATVFKIGATEYDSIKDFVFDQREGAETAQQLLIVSGDINFSGEEKHLYYENFLGDIKFLKVDSVELYFLKAKAHNLQMNGLPLFEGQVHIFPSGSTIKLPTGKPVYYSEVAATYLKDKIDVNVTFNAQNIKYVFPNGNIGLRDINISEDTGKLVGIMGASGSGKSTLLNVLNGNDIPTEGQVLINGIDIHKDKDKVEGVIGYVPQDDLLIDELTVYENLYYNGKLCLSNLTEEQLNDKIIALLKSLDLMSTKDLKVGNVLEKTISGGQRKRLNIGLELLREPSVLFVDEPTSGLSSRDSENIMDLLKELTLKGKIIFVVIHQPSSDIYKMFDKMFILDVGGYCVYYGNPVEALLYFKRKANQADQDSGECITCGNVTPELVFNIIDTKLVDDYGRHLEQRKVSPMQWNTYFQEEIPLKKIEDAQEQPPNSLFIPKKFKQWLVFIKRDVLSKLKNRQYMLINILEAPALAFVLSLIVKHAVDSDKYNLYKNDNLPAYIFMCIVVVLFMGLSLSAEEIIKDRRILKREKFLNLSRGAYLFSKIGILFTFSAVQALLFVWIGNSVLEIDGMGFTYWLILFSVGCFSNILGLNISASFNSAVTIYILIPLLLIPQMILSGAMFSFDKINRLFGEENKVPVLAEVMVSRWAYEALSVEQYSSNEFEKDLFIWHKLESDLNYRMAYWIPELKKMSSEALKIKDVEGKQEEYKNKLQAIENAIKRENASLPKAHQFQFVGIFRPALFDIEFETSFKNYLNDLNDYYSEFFTQVEDLLSDKKAHLFEIDGKNQYQEMKLKYGNESLDDLLKGVTVSNKIKVVDGDLEQFVDPVFRTPDPKVDGYRAHFYASIKPIPFTESYLPTYTYNLIIIWMMSLLAFIALYFEWLKKIIEKISAVKLPAIKLPWMEKLIIKFSKSKEIKDPKKKKKENNIVKEEKSKDQNISNEE